MGVPEPLQVADLLLLERLTKPLAQLLRRSDLLARFLVSVVGRFLDHIRFVGFENLPLAFLEHRHQRFELGPRPAIWLGSICTARASSSSDQLAQLAEGQHVLERRRHQIRRRLRRAGKPLRIVPLVRVDDAAESFAISHRSPLRFGNC